MKKATLIFSILISLSIQAQKRTTQFSIAAESAVMATSQAYQAYNMGFGGSGKLLFPTGKKNYFTGTIGVLAFSGRADDASIVFGSSVPAGLVNIAVPGLTIIPVKAGYKYFLNNKKVFSTEVEAGYTFASVKKVQNSYPGSVGGYTFSGGFGFLVAKKLDIGLRYELFESTASETNYTSFVALRTLLMLDFK